MQLNLSNRIVIEKMLNERKSFKEIGNELAKHPDTIRNEVSLHRIMKLHKNYGKESMPLCINQKVCNKSYIGCYKKCRSYQETKCNNLKYSCSVCNGCELKGTKCRLNKYYYVAEEANKDYRKLLEESRKGINMTKEELDELDSFISPLIKKGLSPEQIKLIYPDLNVSIKTIYNYTNQNCFKIGNLDLLRKVSYKPRKKQKNNVIQKYKENRTYKDFEKYVSDNNIVDIVEMDTVEAIKDDSEPCLLTLLFRRSNLQIAILLPNQKSQTVVDVINEIYEELGYELFSKFFRVILTDNGKEMKLPEEIEFDKNKKRRCLVFYCDSYTSCQKAKCEKNHDFIRRYISKNSSMKKYTQGDINLMMSHINSIPRKDAKLVSSYIPYDKMLNISSLDFLNKLNIKKIELNNLIINKKLFK
ncbi:MAG: IS30 family transposase [Clostridia bacterium]